MLACSRLEWILWTAAERPLGFCVARAYENAIYSRMLPMTYRRWRACPFPRLGSFCQRRRQGRRLSDLALRASSLSLLGGLLSLPACLDDRNVLSQICVRRAHGAHSGRAARVMTGRARVATARGNEKRRRRLPPLVQGKTGAAVARGGSFDARTRRRSCPSFRPSGLQPLFTF